jgi:hypothetical protein
MDSLEGPREAVASARGIILASLACGAGANDAFAEAFAAIVGPSDGTAEPAAIVALAALGTMDPGGDAWTSWIPTVLEWLVTQSRAAGPPRPGGARAQELARHLRRFGINPVSVSVGDPFSGTGAPLLGESALEIDTFASAGGEVKISRNTYGTDPTRLGVEIAGIQIPPNLWIPGNVTDLFLGGRMGPDGPIGLVFAGEHLYFQDSPDLERLGKITLTRSATNVILRECPKLTFIDPSIRSRMALGFPATLMGVLSCQAIAIDTLERRMAELEAEVRAFGATDRPAVPRAPATRRN